MSKHKDQEIVICELQSELTKKNSETYSNFKSIVTNTYMTNSSKNYVSNISLHSSEEKFSNNKESITDYMETLNLRRLEIETEVENLSKKRMIWEREITLLNDKNGILEQENTNLISENEHLLKNQNSLCQELSDIQEKICQSKQELTDLNLQKQNMDNEIEDLQEIMVNNTNDSFSNNAYSNDPRFSTYNENLFDQDDDLLDSSKRSYINFKKSLIEVENQNTEVKQATTRPLQVANFTSVKERQLNERLSSNGENSIPIKKVRSKAKLNTDKGHSIIYQKKKPQNTLNKTDADFTRTNKIASEYFSGNNQSFKTAFSTLLVDEIEDTNQESVQRLNCLERENTRLKVSFNQKSTESCVKDIVNDIVISAFEVINNKKITELNTKITKQESEVSNTNLQHSQSCFEITEHKNNKTHYDYMAILNNTNKSQRFNKTDYCTTPAKQEKQIFKQLNDILKDDYLSATKQFAPYNIKSILQAKSMNQSNRSLCLDGFNLLTTRKVATNLRNTINNLLESYFDKEVIYKYIQEIQDETKYEKVNLLKNEIEKVEILVENLSESCIFLAENCVELLIDNRMFEKICKYYNTKIKRTNKILKSNVFKKYQSQFYQVGIEQLKKERSAKLITNFFRKIIRKKQSQKLRDAHKFHYLQFQAGSGKFLLHNLMQNTENIFHKILDNLKCDRESDRETKRKTIMIDKLNQKGRYSSRQTFSSYYNSSENIN